MDKSKQRYDRLRKKNWISAGWQKPCLVLTRRDIGSGFPVLPTTAAEKRLFVL